MRLGGDYLFGGGKGTGPVPRATSGAFELALTVAVICRNENAVNTTNTASNNVISRFFIRLSSCACDTPTRLRSVSRTA